MSKKVLIIAPLNDVVTVTSNMATYHLLDWIGNRSFNLDIDYLVGGLANRFFLGLMTARKKYDLVIYYGHGNPDNLKGVHILRSMIDKVNIKYLKGMTMSTMACYSGSELAKEAIKQGIVSYIGTVTPYYAAFPEKERNFLKDWVDYTTIKDKLLLRRKSFREAFRGFQDRGQYYINLYAKKKHYRNYDWYLNAVKSNLKNTKLFGNPNIAPLK